MEQLSGSWIAVALSAVTIFGVAVDKWIAAIKENNQRKADIEAARIKFAFDADTIVSKEEIKHLEEEVQRCQEKHKECEEQHLESIADRDEIRRRLDAIEKAQDRPTFTQEK